MECWDERTNVGHPCHEYIDGICTRCGSTDPNAPEPETTLDDYS